MSGPNLLLPTPVLPGSPRVAPTPDTPTAVNLPPTPYASPPKDPLRLSSAGTKLQSVCVTRSDHALGLAPGTFDLYGNPNEYVYKGSKSEAHPSLEPDIQVYVCLVGCAVRPVSSNPSSHPSRWEKLLAPPVPASDLVNPENLQLGLERLRFERNHSARGQGRIFSGTLPLSPGRNRSTHKFLPMDLDADELDRMVSPSFDDPTAYIDMYGSSLVLTDYIVPVPEPLVGARPQSLHHTIVAWLYGILHPAAQTAKQCRVSYDTDEEDDRDPTPIDMDSCYTEAWIQHTIVAYVLGNVACIRRERKRMVHSTPQAILDQLDSQYPWASPRIEVEFPGLGKGDEWLSRRSEFNVP